MSSRELVRTVVFEAALRAAEFSSLQSSHRPAGLCVRGHRLEERVASISSSHRRAPQRRRGPPRSAGAPASSLLRWATTTATPSQLARPPAYSYAGPRRRRPRVRSHARQLTPAALDDDNGDLELARTSACSLARALDSSFRQLAPALDNDDDDDDLESTRKSASSLARALAASSLLRVVSRSPSWSSNECELAPRSSAAASCSCRAASHQFRASALPTVRSSGPQLLGTTRRDHHRRRR